MFCMVNYLAGRVGFVEMMVVDSSCELHQVLNFLDQVFLAFFEVENRDHFEYIQRSW